MKTGLVFLILLFVLTACGPISPAYLEIRLNEGIDTIEVGSTYQDPGAQASYGIRQLSVEVIENTIDVDTVGTYVIVYEATYQNIVKTIRRIVTVVDETPPTVSLNPGIDTLLIDQEWTDEGVEAYDQSGDVTVEIIGEVDTTSAGVYVITYVATDIYDNQTTIERYVTVLDMP